MEKNKSYTPKLITFHAISNARQKGVLKIGQIFLPCAIGKTGRKHAKNEGDEASPIGKWQLKSYFYRADRVKQPKSSLKSQKIFQNDLWCDDPKSALYNKKVRKPFKYRAENLWREDHQYDIMIIIDYNLSPIIKHKGSAIFIHIIKDETYPPTAGCIALKHSDLLKMLSLVGRHTALVI